jgi:heat shock protein HtpX
MNTFKTMLGLTALTALFMWFGHWAGGQSGMLIALVIACVMNFVAYFFSDKIALAMYKAHEVSVEEAPALHGIVEELALRAGIPKPRVYRISSMTPNAFATGRGPGHAAIAVTDGIVGLLDERELRAVLAHELSHVLNRDVLVSTIVATLVGALGFLADMVRWGAIFGTARDDDERGVGLGGIVLALLLPFIAMLIQLFVSRQREFGADETGGQLSEDPLALASALEKLDRGAQARPMDANPATAHLFIVNPFTGQKLASLFSTHPPTEDRVARLVALAREMGQ